MKPAITNGVCRLRCAGHCQQCVDDAGWRASVGTTDPCGDVRGPWRTGLGDLVAKVATPIARLLRLGCIDPKTKELRPESGCAKRRDALNRIG